MTAVVLTVAALLCAAVAVRLATTRRYTVRWNQPHRRTLYQRMHLARIADDVRAYRALQKGGR